MALVVEAQSLSAPPDASGAPDIHLAFGSPMPLARFEIHTGNFSMVVAYLAALNKLLSSAIVLYASINTYKNGDQVLSYRGRIVDYGTWVVAEGD